MVSVDHVGPTWSTLTITMTVGLECILADPQTWSEDQQPLVSGSTFVK